MNKLVKLFKWFIKEEKGNALLLTSATAMIATMGLFFFTALREISIKNKERTTHLYNASVMALSIENFISTYLETFPFPKNKLINNENEQYTADELSKVVDINNYDVLSLESLEQEGYIVSHDDPTAKRELNQEISYDKKATKIKVIFKLNDTDKIEDIEYLVNLAGTTYENNSPYGAGEPFFYIVSFTDDSGEGSYGNYNLLDNELTLIDGDGNPINNILGSESAIPHSERTVILPGDDTWI